MFSEIEETKEKDDLEGFNLSVYGSNESSEGSLLGKDQDLNGSFRVPAIRHSSPIRHEPVVQTPTSPLILRKPQPLNMGMQTPGGNQFQQQNQHQSQRTTPA